MNLSLISVKQRRAFPIVIEQFIKKTPTKAEKIKDISKKKSGRPKGSLNKKKPIVLSEQTRWLQSLLKDLLSLMGEAYKPNYFLYDNALGNAEGVAMLAPLNMHLISKLKCNSALYFPYEGEYAGRGAPRIYGEKVNYRDLPATCLKKSDVTKGIITDVYQLTARHKLFAKPLNIVIIQKTNPKKNQTSQVILFSTDLELEADLLIDYYSLRYQIEFTFRDAKQYLC